MPESVNHDYRHRKYLSAIEAALFLGVRVQDIHAWVKSGQLPADTAASGQQRFKLTDLQKFRAGNDTVLTQQSETSLTTDQLRYHCADARRMQAIPDHSVHLMVTSPPYFDAKMYSESANADLGNIHDLDRWFVEMNAVWREVLRVLAPGRKAFVNIMNLPVRNGNGGYRTLNLVGRTIDEMENLGFIFKRDIVWHKTNGVRAHFGTYPNPGGILINNMHEFILEFDTPGGRGAKYAHVSAEDRQASKLDKDFWLSLKNSDVWLMKPEKSGGRRTHAAPFPLELPARLIRAFSYQNEWVLDPFAGSGTTLIAALNWHRKAIGYEVNPAIAAEAVKRLQGVLKAVDES